MTVKDLFALGGSIGSFGLKNTDIEVREDNLSGTGNSITFRGLYDISRRKNFGGGFEYLQRNIGGSFIDGGMGYRSFFPSIKWLQGGKHVLCEIYKTLNTSVYALDL